MNQSAFPSINRAYNTTFRPQRLSVGLVVPIENYADSDVPTMQQHMERVQLAEQLGFAAVWLRDVPFNVPSFGDAGQGFDPFAYLGFLAGQTSTIALGVASVILPLRHPAHVAKAAATVDVLSGGRLLLGVASGDRPAEYPALDMPFAERGARFRESFAYLRKMAEDYPVFDNVFGRSEGGIDMLPKPVGCRLPLLITGASQQSPDWLAQHGDGWITYPRGTAAQAAILNDWRGRMTDAGEPDKPATQSLYIDLQPDPDAPLQPIHLGFSSGVNYLRDYLQELERIGINHVALNLRFNEASIDETLQRLADSILPGFRS